MLILVLHVVLEHTYVCIYSLVIRVLIDVYNLHRVHVHTIKTDQCSYILTPASDIPLLNVNSHQYTG